MLLRGDLKRARDDLLDIALSLPFQSDVNTGFGILAKVYLDALTHINGRQCVRDANAEGVPEAKTLALEICEETFPGVKNPKGEVERGFRFWDCVSAFYSLISQYRKCIDFPFIHSIPVSPLSFSFHLDPIRVCDAGASHALCVSHGMPPLPSLWI